MTAPATPKTKPATPDKQSAKPSKSPLVLGKGPGPIDNAKIKAKIEKWQAAGGGTMTVVESPAPGSDNDAAKPTDADKDDDGKEVAVEDAAGSGEASKDKEATRPAAKTPSPTKKPQSRPKANDLDEELQAATTPKKRVISDGHWRKNRSPPKDSKPNAWVRPAKKITIPKPEEKEPEPKKSPTKVPLLPKPVYAPDGTRVQAVRRRRKSTISRSSEEDDAGLDDKPDAKSDVKPDIKPDIKSDLKPSPKPSPKPEVKPSPKPSPKPDFKPFKESTPRPNDEKLYEPPSSGNRVRDAIRKHEALAKGDVDGEVKPKRRSVRKAKSIVGDEERKRDESPNESPARGARSEDELRRRRKMRRRPTESRDDVTSPPPEEDHAERRRSRRKVRRPPSSENLDKPSPTQSAPDTPNPSTPNQDQSNADSPGEKVFGSRVEAWLSSTPDPFVEDKDGKEKHRRKSSRRSSSSTEGSTMLSEERRGEKEPEKDRESPSPRHGSRRRRHRRSYDSQDESVLSDDRHRRRSHASSHEEDNLITVEYDESTISSSAPSSIKRRPAKRASESPTKPRPSPVPATIPEDEVVSSVATSSVDPSTADFSDVTPRARNSLRREFPTTGRKLSTIASVETLESKRHPSRTLSQRSDGTVYPDDAPKEDPQPEDSGKPADTMSIMTGMTGMTGRSRNSTRRRLASHADLMSVLSMPERTNSKSKSIVSARSIRTNRSRLATATIGDLMGELQSDETKYMRELRTLVDGVIPVLLTCVLSKSDAAVTAGLFSKTSTDGSKITKPIVEMGIALERLKSLHRRIPKADPEALLSWGQSAQRVYGDYVKSWRLGFQDVVVNLAPASDEDRPDKNNSPAEASTIDEGMARNEEGYVVDGDGERVDVAFLLKRPLVRLKYLSKTFKGVNILKPSDRANDIAAKYQELVTLARKRSNEEKARLEDEAAASIDPTRARDPRSLAPLAGVSIDPTRCVRARDYFDMALLHSSGQEVDCRVELLLRDDAPGRGNSGDLLLCEVDGTGRWLFFPPISVNRLSARNGDLKGEIVVMVRGFKAGGDEWRELLTLRTNDEEVGFEWVQMLGLTPIPSKISRGLSFREKPEKPASRPTSSHGSSSLLSAGTGSTPPIKSRTPSPREIEIPMGEQANESSKKWGRETPDRPRAMSPETPPSSVLSSEIGTLGTKDRSDVVSPEPTEVEDLTPRKTRLAPLQTSSTTFTDAMAKAESPTTPTLKRSKAKRYSRGDPRSARASRDVSLDEQPITPERQTSRPDLYSEPSYTTTSSFQSQTTHTSSSTERGTGNYSVWYPTSEVEDDLSDYSDEEDTPQPTRKLTKRPPAQRRTSSVPSLDLPTIPKLRKTSGPETPTKSEMRAESLPISTPSSAPAKLQKKPPSPKKEELPERDDDEPPPPPPHRVPSTGISPAPLKASPMPNLSPPAPGFRQHRRTSSPLKHEYQPSTCTESSGDDTDLSFDDDAGSVYSESSEDDLEADDVAPLGPLPPMDPNAQFPKPSPPQSMYSSPNATLTPSQSASQGPYRTVPPTNTKPLKTVASIFAWSDKGMWDSLYPDECSIVITPGLIEAFEMTAEHSASPDGDSSVSQEQKRPLIAFELTPLVPLRRGTALDISIRSPPTANSRIRTTANIMFRSRSPEECEGLYSLINQARINNPTYIALQNARGPYGEDSWAAAMDRRNAERTEGSTTGGSSWWGSLGRKNSYRAKSTRALSTSAGTTSSVGTIGSAFSALKRFSAGNKLFNVAKSSMYSSNQDSRSRSTDSLTGEVETSPGTSPHLSNTSDDPTRDSMGMPLGIMNSKIRMYARESSNKWRDMGSARLSIMRPQSTPPGGSQSVPLVRQGQGSPGQRNPELEKRIVVIGKTRGEVLLDVTLSESCFERVARTGIAVSVWEDTIGTAGELGGVAAIGGVAGTKARVYMIQMKSERECAYCFSLLGKLRY